MKNKVLLSVALVAAACNASIGAMQQEVFEKHEFELLNPTVAHRLKLGQITETSIKPDINLFSSEGVFGDMQYSTAAFNKAGTLFNLIEEPCNLLCCGINGSVVSGDSKGSDYALHIIYRYGPDGRIKNTVGLSVVSRDNISSLRPSIKDIVNGFTEQILCQKYINESGFRVPQDVYATIAYAKKKSSDDMFIFDNPIYQNELTMPCYSQGLVCAITSKFPLDVQQGSMNNRNFDGFVMQEIEKNKHVCLYEIKDGKLVLLRNLGNFPYCVGCYVNPQKTMVAVLHGDTTHEPKCLKLITIHDPALLLSSKARDKFADVLICEK